MNQAPLAEIHILVVDDNPGLLHDTVRLLESAGYAVTAAGGGEEAIAVAPQIHPDLILLDRGMPGIDGMAVCRRLKSDPELAPIFVIILSGGSVASDEQAEGLEAGADGYIARPIANRELLARVEAYVRILRLTRSLRTQAEELITSHANTQQARLETLKVMTDSEDDRARLATTHAALDSEIAEHQQFERIQLFLAQTGGGAPDVPFFSALARFLAENLAMDFICIDRLEGDGLTARTEAVWCDGRFEDNVTYALKDTPCGEVVGKHVCCFPSKVCQLFPQDQVLHDLRAESYAGTTLFDHTGKPNGLIAVISRNPLTNRPLIETTLQLVAVRAAGELERLQAEESLRQKLAELERINKLMVGREIRMIELKRDLNELCRQLNLPPRYAVPATIAPESNPLD